MDEIAPTVFVIDDDVSVRKGLGRLFRSAGFAVETFPSAAAYLAREHFDGIGCIVLDVRMPEIDGISLQERLLEQSHSVPIIFLSGHGEVPTSVQAMKQGAVDFLTKPVDEHGMLAAIDEALVRHRRIIRERSSLREIQQRAGALTTREREVMRYVIGGALNKQIAAQLGISEATIKVHRGKVMEKMAVKSVADLVRCCEKAGIAPDTL